MHVRAPYSYRADPTVPPFPDAAPIAFVDGTCGLCSRSAQLIARLDRTGAIRICPAQSPLGRAVFAHYGLDADEPTTWLFLEGGVAHPSVDGVIALGAALGGPARLAAALKLLPRAWREALYGVLARNRYHWFGRADLCAMPDARLKARLITEGAPWPQAA